MGASCILFRFRSVPHSSSLLLCCSFVLMYPKYPFRFCVPICDSLCSYLVVLPSVSCINVFILLRSTNISHLSYVPSPALFCPAGEDSVGRGDARRGQGVFSLLLPSQRCRQPPPVSYLFSTAPPCRAVIATYGFIMCDTKSYTEYPPPPCILALSMF